MQSINCRKAICSSSVCDRIRRYSEATKKQHEPFRSAIPDNLWMPHGKARWQYGENKKKLQKRIYFHKNSWLDINIQEVYWNFKKLRQLLMSNTSWTRIWKKIENNSNNDTWSTNNKLSRYYTMFNEFPRIYEEKS